MERRVERDAAGEVFLPADKALARFDPRKLDPKDFVHFHPFDQLNGATVREKVPKPDRLVRPHAPENLDFRIERNSHRAVGDSEGVRSIRRSPPIAG